MHDERERRRRAQLRREREKKRIRILSIIIAILLASTIGLGIWVCVLLNGKAEDVKTDEIANSTKVEASTLGVDTGEADVAEADDSTSDGADTESTNETDETKSNVRRVENTATPDNHLTEGLPICMYHFVYDKENPPAHLDSNFIEQDALRKEMQYLVDNDYYFPTWEEVRAYVDGDLLLPKKSIVLTFDDADQSFLDLGIPILEEVGVPATSFVITIYDGPNKVKNYESPYITYESHTHDMHKAGGSIGHGGIFTAKSVEDGVSDLKTSIEICGNGDAFAYPFGDYNDTSVQAVKEAGFRCAVTTEPGRVQPGDDPLLLPRVRMSEGQTLESFINKIS